MTPATASISPTAPSKLTMAASRQQSLEDLQTIARNWEVALKNPMLDRSDKIHMQNYLDDVREQIADLERASI